MTLSLFVISLELMLNYPAFDLIDAVTESLSSAGFWSRGSGFETTCCRFETWAISFNPLCPCLSEETLKAVGLCGVYERGSKISDTGKWKKLSWTKRASESW